MVNVEISEFEALPEILWRADVISCLTVVFRRNRGIPRVASFGSAWPLGFIRGQFRLRVVPVSRF